MTQTDREALEALIRAMEAEKYAQPAGKWTDACTRDGTGRSFLSAAEQALIVAAVNALPQLLADSKRAERLEADRTETHAVCQQLIDDTAQRVHVQREAVLAQRDEARAERDEFEARAERLAKQVRGAFVDGAKWWEFKKTGATMWGSDQNDASAEAARLYPNEPTRYEVALIQAEQEATARAERLEQALAVVERRIRENTDPIAALVNRYGGAVERASYAALYAACIHAQAALGEVKP